MYRETGDRIKELRKQRGLTQKEFCKIINAKQAKLSCIERGTNEPGIEIIMTICKTFNVSADWLLFGEKSGGNTNKPFEEEFSKQQQELIDITNKMTDQEQTELLGAVKMFIHTYK